MRRESYFFCLLFILVSQAVSGQTPTIAASNVTFNLLEGNGFRINWTLGNGARRIIVMRQGSAVTALPVNGTDYNPSTTFGSGDAIAAGQFVVYDNTSSFMDVSGLQPNTTYHVAIFEYNGTASATQYLTSSFATASQPALSSPTAQASNVIFSNIIGNSMTLTWTNGNGARRLVVARQGSAVNANPVDLTFYNSSGGLFGNGTQIGTGNYSVYSSTGNTANVTGLQPNTTYHYSLFEYNGSTGPVFLIPGAIANATTLPRPTTAASNVTFNLIEGNGVRISWTSGNGARRIIVARAGSAVTAVPTDGVDYTASGTFGNGDAVQPGQFVVYDNASTFADISNLLPNTIYHFRIYEYDGSGATTAYLTSSFAASSQSTLAAPATQASNVNFTNLSGTSVTINWTNGSGARRLVVARANSAVNADPVNLTFYGAASAFGTGAQIGTGNFVVYNGTGNSVAVTNLQINTAYHVAVYELNGSNGPVYTVPGAIGNVTTPAQPTISASAIFFNLIDGGGMRINWTSGNGARRIVVARAGSPVTAVPADGTDYAANSIFGSGDAIQPGEFVVYDNIASFVDLSGMQPATTYHFRIYEYNGSGVTTSYLTSSFASGTQATLSAPTIQASVVNFTNIGGSTVRINWTNGNGAGRIVVARQGSAVNADPVNLTFYSGNATFGSGTQIGAGNFVVYRGAGALETIINLIPGTTYHFAVYEYNGSTLPAYAVPAATGSVITAAQPTVAASAMFFNIVEGNSLRVNWTNGNGQRRIIVARAGSAVTAVPSNGIDYTANTVFGSGDAILPNQFVVFDAATTFVDLSNLLPNTIYHFAMFEYDGTGSNTVYLTSSFLSGNQSTVITPSAQASNVGFSSIAGTSVTVGWTNGNGIGRLVLARQGSPVNADPVDLQNYSPNTSFGSGVQAGTGNYSVYAGNASTVNVANLTSGTTYHFAIYEYNGGGAKVYLVPGATGSVTTLGPPQVQATAASTSNITATTMQLGWATGSGNRRLVLMKQGTAVDATPADNSTYNANSAFGSGTEAGTGNFVVFNGTSNTVLVTNLQANTTYHFAVFEFNAFGASSQFLTVNPARGNATTLSILPVTFIDFTAKNDKNNIKLEWSTAQESNSSHFEIQKSAHNNTQNFVTAGIVNAAGESAVPRDYTYTDESAFEGVTWYRLKQVDKDGRFMYSRIVSVKYEPRGLIKKILNPVRSGLFIQLTSFTADTHNEWRLYDMSGRIVHRQSFGSQVIYGVVPAIAAGIYILEVRMGDKSEKVRVSKVN